jgi:hypothetical protein
LAREKYRIGCRFILPRESVLQKMGRLLKRNPLYSDRIFGAAFLRYWSWLSLAARTRSTYLERNMMGRADPMDWDTSWLSGGNLTGMKIGG